MTLDALLAYFHFAALIGITSLLIAELALIAQPAAPGQVHRLRALHKLGGPLAMLTLASGFARVIWGAKGSAFYLSNPVFHLKVTLFIIVGLLSIYPTRKFVVWAAAAAASPPALPEAGDFARVRRVVTVQLALAAMIPLAATLMARGVGLG